MNAAVASSDLVMYQFVWTGNGCFSLTRVSSSTVLSHLSSSSHSSHLPSVLFCVFFCPFNVVSSPLCHLSSSISPTLKNFLSPRSYSRLMYLSACRDLPVGLRKCVYIFQETRKAVPGNQNVISIGDSPMLISLPWQFKVYFSWYIMIALR